MLLHTHSIDQTLALGRLLGTLAPPPPGLFCIALDGPLGAGKTHLTRGIAEGAGVDDPTLVSSPTYVLMNIYPGSKPIWHLDAYRITSEEDFAALGMQEIFAPPTLGGAGGGIVIIEWAARVAGQLPSDHLHIEISHEDDTSRSFRLSPHGEVSKTVLNHLLHRWPAAHQQAQQQQ
ncbi:MAG TPA: tRNA (adenosine(37)-N6)-threonylcarbamoyltransferase complex ATPase subunit type 1 TsaE [Phycisphaerae bacterium]|jgi:tRNA threonylcarbamoyladenosine biosynthesis protein TsaE|nr:tRNA (adenosine(37)-N6)-threonylcarbamoyltransferase complex ATPase subunit type 1 TsaE [Phycisphaerae bacterium]